jgi:hypothetical protein
VPLSKAEPRDHVHSREIRCRGYRRADQLWDIEAVLEDTKTYSFDNVDRAGVAAGEPVHRMAIRLTVDDDMRVHAVEAVTDAAPFHICGDITPRFRELVGLVVGPGWRKAVMARMAGVCGCTHLTELLLGPVTTTAMQTVAAARARRAAADPQGQMPPPILNTCHALAADGPIVARQWPQFSTRKADQPA